MAATPRYTHHCDVCRSLGRFTFHAPHYYSVPRTVDLYHCQQSSSSMGGSVLARYGDEPSDYASAPISIVERCYLGADLDGENSMAKALGEAYRRVANRETP